MTTTTQHAATSPLTSASKHLTVLQEDARPAEIRFTFEQQEKRLGGAMGLSVVSHVLAVLLMIMIGRLIPEPVYDSVLPDRLSRDIVWLAEPGPGGGGGGGNRSPEPPKRAELPGREKITVPTVKPPEPSPEPPKKEPEPEQTLTIPAQTMAAATQAAPGAIESNQTSTDSRGSGTGTGAGPGEGSGLGPGVGGGTGGGVYRPGNGVTVPRVLQEIKPNYTAEAMRAKVQGTVLLECIVLPDGTVGKVDVVRSLDSTFGLDAEAIKAAKRWRFAPGMRQGEPVATLVLIELSFTLR